jgi:hypothetical protein
MAVMVWSIVLEMLLRQWVMFDAFHGYLTQEIEATNQFHITWFLSCVEG